MSEEGSNDIPSAIPTKTYVRGAYLYSTDDGTGYEEKARNRVQDEVTIEDKANLGSLKRQIQSKKQEIIKKKQKAKKQKQMLIPIRDTPVEPLPQPMTDNNKCQRATQEQFQYFQTYISLKQKQKKFEQEEARKIELFERQQQRFRKNQDNQDRKGISIVLEKQQKSPLLMNKSVGKKKGPSIKVVIKKKDNTNEQSQNASSQKKDNLQTKKSQNDEPQEQENLQQVSKVRVIQNQNSNQQ